MTRTIDDPDLGEIEVPDAYLTEDEWEAARRELAEGAWERAWPEGSRHRCPVCDEPTFEAASDLAHRLVVRGHVLSFRHLHGARCSACGAQALEGYELMGLEAEAGAGVKADYAAKVSRIGSGTLGTYWPRDVVRVLGLKPHQRAFIEVVDQDAVLVRFERADD